MSHVKLILPLLPVLILIGCRVTVTAVAGEYVDAKYGDTLSLTYGGDYEYKERLNNGEFGWNTGRFSIVQKKISFFDTKPTPVVGFRLQMIPYSNCTSPFEWRFILKDTNVEVAIDSAEVFSKNMPLGTGSFFIKRNQLTILDAKVDSVMVFCKYFPSVGIRVDKLVANKRYLMKISPAERLYELDKTDYRYHNKHLFSKNKTGRFKKVSNL